MAVIFTKNTGGGTPSPAPETVFEDQFTQGLGTVTFRLTAEEKAFLENLGHPETLVYENQQGLLTPYPRRENESNERYALRAAATGHPQLTRVLLGALCNRGLGGVFAFASKDEQETLTLLAAGRLDASPAKLAALLQPCYQSPRYTGRAQGLNMTLTEYAIRRILEEHQRAPVLWLFWRLMRGGFDGLKDRQPAPWREAAQSLWEKEEPLLRWEEEEHNARKRRDAILAQLDRELDQFMPVITEAARNHTIVTHPEVIKRYEAMNAAEKEFGVILESVEKKRRLSKINDEVLMERIHRHLRQMKFGPKEGDR